MQSNISCNFAKSHMPKGENHSLNRLCERALTGVNYPSSFKIFKMILPVMGR
jgi:hypothetical protein